MPQATKNWIPHIITLVLVLIPVAVAWGHLTSEIQAHKAAVQELKREVSVIEAKFNGFTISLTANSVELENIKMGVERNYQELKDIREKLEGR